MSFEGWLNNLDSAKWIFAVAYVSATIGVAIGVYFDSDTKSKETKRFGERLLLWSLVFDTLFTILIFATDGWISQIQNSEIIVLERRLASRSLTNLQQEAIKRRMVIFAGQHVSIGALPVTKEHTDFATQLFKILKGAGVNADINQLAAEDNIGSANGVMMRYTTGNERGLVFSGELMSELDKADIEAHGMGGLNEILFHPPAPQPYPDRNADSFSWVVIGVGDK